MFLQLTCVAALLTSLLGSAIHAEEPIGVRCWRWFQETRERQKGIQFSPQQRKLFDRAVGKIVYVHRIFTYDQVDETDGALPEFDRPGLRGRADARPLYGVLVSATPTEILIRNAFGREVRKDLYALFDGDPGNYSRARDLHFEVQTATALAAFYQSPATERLIYFKPLAKTAKSNAQFWRTILRIRERHGFIKIEAVDGRQKKSVFSGEGWLDADQQANSIYLEDALQKEPEKRFQFDPDTNYKISVLLF